MIKLRNPNNVKLHPWLVYDRTTGVVLDAWQSEALAVQAGPEWCDVVDTYALVISLEEVEIVEDAVADRLVTEETLQSLYDNHFKRYDKTYSANTRHKHAQRKLTDYLIELGVDEISARSYVASYFKPKQENSDDQPEP